MKIFAKFLAAPFLKQDTEDKRFLSRLSERVADEHPKIVSSERSDVRLILKRPKL